MTQSPEQEIPKIDYPCEWQYTIISTDSQIIKEVIASIIQPKTQYNLKNSRISSKGKYCSVLLTVIVQDETIRDEIFTALRQHNAIKMVI